jgi:pyruvate kinase
MQRSEEKGMRRTKIICTIGPASREPKVPAQLVREGMDVARLNMAHGSLEEHAENVTRIRTAAQQEGRPVAIQVDLQGPKLRVGKIDQPGIELRNGEQVTLTTRDVVGQGPNAVPVQNENLVHLVGPGDRILLDDGLIDLRVTQVQDLGVQAHVRVGGRLKSNKGINLPGVSAELPALTDKDRHDLEAALDWGVDWLALSFVRSAASIQQLRSLIVGRSKHIPVMAKIEKPQALQNLREIIRAADAVMVARGDLGIEIPPEEVPMAQKRVIAACNDAGVPVVTATQMLDSMLRNPRPTRAEASDVANAILDGTDALMLSGETSIGAYPVEAVRTMVRIAKKVEQESTEVGVQGYRPVEGSRVRSIANAVGHSARDVAYNLGAAAMITPTASGYTARVMSRYRPNAPVIAITPDQKVQRRLMLSWGVTPLLAPRAENTDEMIDHAVRTARERNLIRNGDTVVITGGSAHSEPGTTNLMRVYVVTQD